MASRTTLKAKKTNEIIYPQTQAEIVYTLTGRTVEEVLQEYGSIINALQQNTYFKGYFKNESKLLAQYPNGISNSEERAGWYAIVGSETEQDNWYIWDVEDNMWEKSASYSIEGVASVNNIRPDEDTGNVTLNATHIPTTFDDKASIQSHLSDLKLKYNDQEDAIKEIENELEPLKNKTNVLYLTNEQMMDAINRLIEPYDNGQVVVVNDDGNYKLGSSFKFIVGGTEETPEYSWEEITASGTSITDTLTLSKEVFVPEVPDKEGVEIDSIENISTDYGFELNENGFYESNNKGINNSHAYCKLTFTVPETMDVIFDVINSGETNYDFGIFSNLDDTVLNSNYEDPDGSVYKKYKNHSSTSIEQLTYPNVTAGQHFISIKYKKDGSSNSGNDSLQFRLNEECTFTPGTPSYTYISENSISIDDHNNLQIEGKNILKDGDVIPTIKKLVGDVENPICLLDLEIGFYLISGSIKSIPTSTTVYKVINGYLLVERVSGYYCTIYNYVSDNNYVFDLGFPQYKYVVMALVNSSLSSVQTLLTYNELVEKSGVLTKTNTSSYTPTSDYNPATLKFVIDTINSSKEPPIKEIENPSNQTDSSLANNIVTSNEYDDNKLFYYKKSGYHSEQKQLEYNKQVDNIYLLKSLSSLNINTSYWASITFSYKYNDGYKDREGDTNVRLAVYIYSATFPKIAARDANNNQSSEIVIYENNAWISDEEDNSEYFNLKNLFEKNYKKLGINMSSYPQITVTKAKVNYIQDTQQMSYFSTKETSNIITPTRIALYEDLQNAGGSSGSSSKPITKFDNPAQWGLDTKYDDTFGTSKDLNNQELYYYKKVDEHQFFAMLVGDNSTNFYNAIIQKDIKDVVTTETKDLSIMICQLNVKDESEQILGSVSIVLNIDANGSITSISIPEFNEDIYSTQNGWLEEDPKYFNIKEYLITKPQYSNMKYVSVGSNLSMDDYPEIYSIGEMYFFGSLEENIDAILPIRLALYSDVAGIQQSADYKGDYQGGRWYNVGDIVSGVGEGIFYVCLVENNGIVQPEYFNEYTEQDGVRYWQNMNYNTYISLNAMQATSDHAGRNIYATYSTKVELQDAENSLGADINVTFDSNTSDLKMQLVNKQGVTIGTEKKVNLALESAIVSGDYDAVNKKIIFTLQNGSNVEIDVADIVSGLVPDTRTINGKTLKNNVTLTAEDIQVVQNQVSIEQVFKNLDSYVADMENSIIENENNISALSGRKINNKPLTSDVTLTGDDIPFSDDYNLSIPLAFEELITQFSTTLNNLTVNNKAISTNPVLTASDISTTFGSDISVQGALDELSAAISEATINGKNIIDNPVLTASDVGALPNTTKIPTGTAGDHNSTTIVDASSDLPTSNAVKEFVENKAYATQSSVASLQQSLGTQCTFVLSGTTLTITPK